MTTAYWWNGRPNFGDLLTPLLLDHFADLRVDWAPAKTADLVCVGSVLEHLPHDWAGIVAGSGRLWEKVGTPLPNATVLGVRGPLTARGMQGDPVLGDPGLLADELVTVDKQWNLGLVPHWSDHELEYRFAQWKPVIIRPDEDPLEVVRLIGSCRKIVSSSLHGVIVADAFGIPRRIEMTPRFEKEGGDFKFRDHNAAVGVKHEIGVTQEAARWKVQDRQHELYDMLHEVGRLLT